MRQSSPNQKAVKTATTGKPPPKTIALDNFRVLVIVETTSEDLLNAMEDGTVSVLVQRELENCAGGLAAR
jgi:hypothetical protein